MNRTIPSYRQWEKQFCENCKHPECPYPSAKELCGVEPTSYRFEMAEILKKTGNRQIMTENKIFIGIDPGKSGAIAFIKPDGYEVHDMPVLKSKGGGCEIDPNGLLELLSGFGEKAFCIVERQRHIAMPGRKQGGNSIFATGYGYGLIMMALTASNIPFHPIEPKQWKKEYGLGKDKSMSVMTARQTFPAAADRLLKSKDGRAEALLMADYARRCYSSLRNLKD